MKHITDLTPPVSFYLRGEEYSAQLEAFGRAINRKEAQRNDFATAAQTDLTIEMIEASCCAGASRFGGTYASRAQIHAGARLQPLMPCERPASQRAWAASGIDPASSTDGSTA